MSLDVNNYRLTGESLGLADLVIHPVMFAESCYSLRVGRTVSG